MDHPNLTLKCREKINYYLLWSSISSSWPKINWSCWTDLEISLVNIREKFIVSFNSFYHLTLPRSLHWFSYFVTKSPLLFLISSRISGTDRPLYRHKLFFVTAGQWFSNFGMIENHPEGLLKRRLLALLPGFCSVGLGQWGEDQTVAFLTHSQVSCCCRHKDHALRTMAAGWCDLTLATKNRKGEMWSNQLSQLGRKKTKCYSFCLRNLQV